MKILVICQYYYPEQFKINEICENLAKEGHTITVLTGLPNYPTGEIPKEYRWGKKRKELINGVNIIRSFEVGRRNSIVGLALNYGSYMISASVKSLFLKKDYDIIFSYQLSPITMVMPAVIMKKRTQKPLYLYCCDIWPESIKNLLPNETGFVFKLVKRFSTYLYSKCDGITVSSKPFIKYFIGLHMIPIEKISYFPQHSKEIALHPQETSMNGDVDFMFMGNIGIAQDIQCILEAAERLKDIPNFRVHFVGEGSQLESSQHYVRDNQLNDIIIFHGHHPVEKMQEFYEMADACLLTLKADNITGLTMPSKLQGYMAAGKVVIGAINGAAQEVIKESQCGICVSAGDSAALAEAMLDFIHNPSKYQNCGQNGRNYFNKHFTLETYINKLQAEFVKLIEEKSKCSKTKH